MSYWYPTQARIGELDAEILASKPSESVDLLDYSVLITRARSDARVPPHQIQKWIWLASQFRLNQGSGNNAERLSYGALEFLRRALTADAAPASDPAQDLRWVLDASVRRLAVFVGAGQIRSCLSDAERVQIELCLAGYNVEEFDAATLRHQVNSRLTQIEKLAGGSYLSAIATKVDALFEAAARGTPEAQRAIRYLADDNDVLPDRNGILGLVDDIYVVEWAFAASVHETRCLPVLEALLERYPHVADLPLLGTPPTPMGTYAQYAVCAALHSLFTSGERQVLCVRQAGPLPLLAAISASIECVRSHADELDRDMLRWTGGQHVTISDGKVTFYVMFDDVATVGDKEKLRIGVRNGKGTQGCAYIHLPKDVVPYMAKAEPFAASRLAKGQNVLEWCRVRHVDPLINIAGAAKRALERRRCVLLLGPRWKLDELLAFAHPMGTSVGALFGARYMSEGAEAEQSLAGSNSDDPFLYASSDPRQAAKLLREPPEDVEGWYVIVDGAHEAHALFAELSAVGAQSSAPICTFVETNDREEVDRVADESASLWMLEHHDVQASPAGAWRANEGEDALVRALARLPNYWTATQTFIELRNQHFESLALLTRQLRRAPDAANERQNLDLAVSTLLRRSLACPIAHEKLLEQLRKSVRYAAELAGPLRPYDQSCAALYEALQPAEVASGAFVDRSAALREAASGIEAGERSAVLCHSERTAEFYRTTFADDAVLGRLNWVTIQTIRRNAPLERLFVPGWLDKTVMREISLSGYGEQTIFLFYPFEREWHASLMGAQHRWERRIQNVSVKRLRAVADTVCVERTAGRLWSAQSDIRSTPAPIEPEREIDDAVDHDYLEARALTALVATLPRSGHGDRPVKARLILFEDEGRFAYLPPAGEVIVLSGQDEPATAPTRAAHAEQYLYRSVGELRRGMVLAFPAGSDKDLLDARADQFLKDAEATRALGALWKIALRRYLEPLDRSEIEFSKLLAEANQRRDPLTVRAWATQTNTIAPRNYRVLIPLIAKLTQDEELLARTDAVRAAVESIYRAREQAAVAIVHELLSGDINLDEPELSFAVGGRKIHFTLHRVLAVRPAELVPQDKVGKILQLGRAGTLL